MKRVGAQQPIMKRGGAQKISQDNTAKNSQADFFQETEITMVGGHNLQSDLQMGEFSIDQSKRSPIVVMGSNQNDEQIQTQKFKSVDEIKEYYEEQQRSQFQDAANVMPATRNAYLNRNTAESLFLFFRVIFWHLTFYFFNVLQLPFILILEGPTATKNLGFWWFTSYMDHMFSLSLIMNTLLFWTVAEEGIQVPWVINFILIYTIIFRCFKISSRYMYMSTKTFHFWKNGSAQIDTIIDDVLYGWVNAWPALIDREIFYTMQRENMEDCTFNFCCVTKMENELIDYLNFPNPPVNQYWKDYMKIRPQIQQKMECKNFVTQRFLDGNGVDRDTDLDELVKTDKHVKKNLAVYKNIQKALYSTPCLREQFTYYSARKFCRMLIEKANIQFPVKLMDFWSVMTQMATALIIPIMAEILAQMYNLDSKHLDEFGEVQTDLTQIEQSYTKWQFWAYVGSALPVNVFMGLVNTFFLNSAQASYARRRYLMQHMSSMLEYNVYQKPASMAYIPVVNFIDPTSLIAWLNMRTVLQGSGLRYFKRMDTYMLVYIILVVLNYIYLIAYGFDYVPTQYMASPTSLFAIQMYFLNAGVRVFLLMNSAAWVNRETEYQIVSVNNIRGMLNEISQFKELYLEFYCLDDQGLEFDDDQTHQTSSASLNPLVDSKPQLEKKKPEIINPGTYSALQYYKNYKQIFGEEKADELLDQAMTRCDVVLDFLDKDLSYAPVRVFGMALQPEFIENLMGLIASVLLSYFQYAVLKYNKAQAAAAAEAAQQSS